MKMNTEKGEGAETNKSKTTAELKFWPEPRN